MASKDRFNPVVLVGPSKLGQRDADEISNLLEQLSNSAVKIDDKDLNNILAQPNFRLVILKDSKTDKIIGIASIYYSKTLMHPRGAGIIGDVVVDEKYRKLGLGDLLVNFLLGLARVWNLSKVELTSKPERVAANKLYLKFGFKKVGTNFYKLSLKKKTH